MLVEKNLNGAWCISALISGQLITRRYFYHTKKEAVKQFNLETKGAIK